MQKSKEIALLKKMCSALMDGWMFELFIDAQPKKGI